MLPIIMIVTFLLAAVLILLFNSKVAAKFLSLAALAAGVLMSILMIAQTVAQGAGRLEFIVGGGTWNFALSVGPLESFMALLFSGIGFFITWASCTMIEHDVEEAKIPLYYTLICGLIATLCGVVFFDNLFNIYVFIELSSFAAAGIVIIKNQSENIRAGLKYLTLSILGSGMVLMGVVILFTVTGSSSLTMAGIHSLLANSFHGNETNIVTALIFVTVGICFKSALFPCHIWLPDAHGTAPSPSSAVLSSLVLKAYIIFYIKVLYRMVGGDFFSGEHVIAGLRSLLDVVLVMGVVAMIAGSCMAILQTDIKRMIAYSSVAQIGYIFMGIGLGTELGLYAAIFHILAHAVTKAGLFLMAGSIIEQTHERRLDKMGGLGIQMPITMTMFTIGSLSMVGIPLFVGFNSKWNFAMAIMDSGKFWVMVALAVSALLNALYYLPIVIRAFFGKEAREKAEHRVLLERPITALAPIMILSALVIVIAIAGGPFVNLIQSGVASIW